MKLLALIALAACSSAAPVCIPLGTPSGGPAANVPNTYAGSPPPLALSPATSQAMADKLEQALSWLQQNFPPSLNEKDSCVFLGAGGRALLFLRLAQNSPESSAAYLSVAEKYIDAALNNTVFDPQFIGFLKGLPGLQAIAAVVYKKQGRQEDAKQMLRGIQSTFDSVNGQSRWNFDQGMSGLLYTNLFLQAHFGADAIPESSVSRVVNALYSRGSMNKTTDALEFGPGVRGDVGFIGLGVGYSGPITILMNYLDMITDPQAPANLKATIQHYASLQAPDGNMPSDYPNRVQWCHGAPGFIGVFLKGFFTFDEPAFLSAAMLAANFTEANGVILKGMQLGHGTAGNSYAVKQVALATNSTLWLRKSLGMHLQALESNALTSMDNMTVYDCKQGSTWVDGPGSMAFAYSDWLSHKNNLAGMNDVPFPAFGEVL